jgi:hypothetical protein
MEAEGTDVFRKKIDEARSLMERALAILDEAEAPAQIGAHLDMAISSLDSATTRPPVNRMDEPPYPQESCAWPIRPAA